MNITNPRFALNLTAQGQRTRPGVSGAATLGLVVPGTPLLECDVAYSLRLTMGAGLESTLELSDPELSPLVSATGTAQAETATAAGTTTAAGKVRVTVTNALYFETPLVVDVDVAEADTAAAWADKVRVALAANTEINTRFAVSGTSTSIILTDRIPNANQGTFNVALANGTPSPGITPAAVSANTTAGVAGARGAEMVDFEGVVLPGCQIRAVLLEIQSGAVSVSGTGDPEVMRVYLADYFGKAYCKRAMPLFTTAKNATDPFNGPNGPVPVIGLRFSTLYPTVLDVHVFGDAL